MKPLLNYHDFFINASMLAELVELLCNICNFCNLLIPVQNLVETDRHNFQVFEVCSMAGGTTIATLVKVNKLKTDKGINIINNKAVGCRAG